MADGVQAELRNLERRVGEMERFVETQRVANENTIRLLGKIEGKQDLHTEQVAGIRGDINDDRGARKQEQAETRAGRRAVITAALGAIFAAVASIAVQLLSAAHVLGGKTP